MNEFLRQFIMTGIRDMIAREVALYQTYQYASGWFSKGVLLQEDLEEIERLYEEKSKSEVVEEGIVIEETIIEEEEVIETPIVEDLTEEMQVEENIEDTSVEEIPEEKTIEDEEILETSTESEV